MSSLPFIIDPSTGALSQAPAAQPVDNSVLALILALVAIFFVFYHHHLSGHVALGA